MVLFLYFILSLLVFSTSKLYFIYFIALDFFFVYIDRLFIESLLRIMRSVTSHRYSVSHNAEARCSLLMIDGIIVILLILITLKRIKTIN